MRACSRVIGRLGVRRGSGVLGVLAAAALGGCRSGGEVGAGPVYPESLPRAQTLDIHAFRQGPTLRMTNTSARSFGRSMVWINGRFGYEVTGFAIGQTLELPLARFTDERGRRFRAGGFFAAEPPDLLALVELETLAGRREKLGLIAVGQRR